MPAGDLTLTVETDSIYINPLNEQDNLLALSADKTPPEASLNLPDFSQLASDFDFASSDIPASPFSGEPVSPLTLTTLQEASRHPVQPNPLTSATTQTLPTEVQFVHTIPPATTANVAPSKRKRKNVETMHREDELQPKQQRLNNSHSKRIAQDQINFVPRQEFVQLQQEFQQVKDHLFIVQKELFLLQKQLGETGLLETLQCLSYKAQTQETITQGLKQKLERESNITQTLKKQLDKATASNESPQQQTAKIYTLHEQMQDLNRRLAYYEQNNNNHSRMQTNPAAIANRTISTNSQLAKHNPQRPRPQPANSSQVNFSASIAKTTTKNEEAPSLRPRPAKPHPAQALRSALPPPLNFSPQAINSNLTALSVSTGQSSFFNHDDSKNRASTLNMGTADSGQPTF